MNSFTVRSRSVFFSIITHFHKKRNRFFRGKEENKCAALPKIRRILPKKEVAKSRFDIFVQKTIIFVKKSLNFVQK